MNLNFRPLLFGLAFLVGLANRAMANVPGGGNEGPAVTLTRPGPNRVVLSNGVITATINTQNARILSLLYRGQEMVSRQGRHRTIYFFGVGAVQDGPADCVFSVRRQTPDMVDVSCKRVYQMGNTNMAAWDIDVHFVLRRGASGLYTYMIADHPARYPELKMGQFQMIWSMPLPGEEHFFEKIYVDDARHWEMPSMADFAQGEVTGIEEIIKLNTGSWKGRYDCKYMYSATYRELGCWGFASDRHNLGAWVVFGSHEFFNDGPTMSDLTSATGIIQVMFNMNHYNGTGLTVTRGESWQKIFGPYLLYFNANPAGGDACWADAARQADAERQAWPYAWMSGVNGYPLKDGRSMVAGRLTIKDPLKPDLTGARAWVGLAQPDPGGNWQFEPKRYQYWERATSDGSFVIPHVRPGTYTLYAFNTGALNEFSQTNIIVKAGESTVLGELAWNVAHPGRKIAWEIGVPDRTAREFRHGNDYFLPLLWDKFPSEFSNPLEYTVGVSDWSKDWNYVHCGYPQGERWSPWKWRIHFNLADVPRSGDATLTLAYASSYYGRTEIYVNDESKMHGGTAVHPAVDGGNALIREGIHAKYCVERVNIPVSLLRPGTNTITLIQGENRFDRAFYHVMYDYLSLELPRQASD